MASKNRISTAALGLVSLLVSSYSTRAAAQDSEPGPEPPPKPQTAAPPAPAPAPPPKPDESLTLGPLQRLPASAYPEPYTRGIEGGSLRTTFHGLQWPYYPKTGIGVSG